MKEHFVFELGEKIVERNLLSLVCGRCGAEHPSQAASGAAFKAGVCRDCGAALKWPSEPDESELGALSQRIVRERSKGDAARSSGSVVRPPTKASFAASAALPGEQDFDARIGSLLKKSNSEPPPPRGEPREAPSRAAPRGKARATLLVIALGVGAAVGVEFAVVSRGSAVSEPARAELPNAVNAPPLAAPPLLAIERAQVAPNEGLPEPSAADAKDSEPLQPLPAEPAAPGPATVSNDLAQPERAHKASPEAEAMASADPPDLIASPFNAAAAERAIDDGARLAQGCKQPGGPEGVAIVTITFAPSGRATTATVSGEPFAGTSIGGCIAAKLRAVRVPPFGGEFITVKKTVPLK